MSKVGDRAATESLKELLSGTRKDLDTERFGSVQLKKDIEKLRSRIDELQAKIAEEHANAVRYETLSNEYNLQIEELRTKLTDTRFNSTRQDLDRSDERRND